MDGLKLNGWKFKETLERIFEKYSQPFEDDQVINLEDMTVDTLSGRQTWCPNDSKLCFPQKKPRNNPKEKSDKLYEPDVSQEHPMSAKLSSHADQFSDIEVLKDGQCTQSTSKLQTSISIGEMNVGDKYKIDVDILATGDGNLGKQVLVECVGRNKDKPLIMFTPTSKVKIGSSCLSLDCSDDFQTISEELNHSSKSEHDDKDDSNFASVSYDQLLARPLCVSGSKELSYALNIEKSRSNILDLGETIPTYIDQASVESHDDTSSGLSDTTLIDIYPSMLASMSNLLDRSYKTQAASRLIKHYRRLQLNVCKSMPNTTHDGIRIKAKMIAHKLKACAGTKQIPRKVCSLKRYKTTQGNQETSFSMTTAEDTKTVLQTNSKSSQIETFKFRNSYNDASYSQPLLRSPSNPKSPVPVTNCCNMRKISACNVTSMNGSSLHQLNTSTNSCNLKILCPKPNTAMAQSPSSRIILNHLPNAEPYPLNNNTVTKQDSVVANCNRSPFGVLLCSSNFSCTDQRNKQRHSISSVVGSVPTMFHSIQSPFKTQAQETDAFESMYQNLVRSSFSLSTTMKLPNILNVCSVSGRTITSVASIPNSPSQLSRKRAACIDQKRETSQLPLKRFRSFPESSSSRQSSQEMLLLNTVLQRQNYHGAQIGGFYSPRSQQDGEKITAGSRIKWEGSARLYSNSGTVLPVINSSGNTVSLCLSPRLRNRVSRKLDYNKLNTPV
ncbi:uncharacterized protein [Heptranchias perlo]|uniref:uncharacterized protein n=1 Tax=Heptranchias perlo TaxID=212740 RepID=UPI00355A7052